MSDDGWCCQMRRKFLIGIVGHMNTVPDAVDVVDFMDFERTAESGAPILRIRFCPWCGKSLPGDAPRHETDFTQEGR